MTRSTVWLLGIWLVVLVTAVPWSMHRLLFEAPREEYAVLITFVFGWLFGYWPIVIPLAGAIRLYQLIRRLRQVRAANELTAILSSREAETTLTETLVQETGIPRFLARGLLSRLLREDALRAQVSRSRGVP